MRIEEIWLADSRITSMKVILEKKTIEIVSPYYYDIPLKKEGQGMIIDISNWSNISITTYNSSTNEYKDLEKTENIETFLYIQEIECDSNTLIFNGWSKESDAWLVYRILNANVNIRTSHESVC